MINPIIYCPSIRPEYFAELSKSVHPIPVQYIDGSNVPCLSYLLNKIITIAEPDYVIIANDKARPTTANVAKMLELFSQGFGFVALYRLGFFGLLVFLRLF